MIALAASGAEEGLWLRAERQTAGRGRQGRAWESPPGNLYASTIVRLRPGDPPAATLAMVAAVALEEVTAIILANHAGVYRPSPVRPGGQVASPPDWLGTAGDSSRLTTVEGLPFFPASEKKDGASTNSARTGWGLGPPPLSIKWPNDLLLGGAKLSGILLERAGDAVVIGIGVNLAHHPEGLPRPVTSLAAHGALIAAEPFLEMLAQGLARWLERWRSEGIDPVRRRWVERAHPKGTALTANLPDGSAVEGLFDGLDGDGALVLRLADGTSRVIHAADVFLI